MKSLVVAGSKTHSSINRALIDHAMVQLRDLSPGTEVKHFEFNDYDMPIQSIDGERDTGIPAATQDFFAGSGRRMLTPHVDADLRGTTGIGRGQDAWDAEGTALTRPADIAAPDDLLRQLAMPVTGAVAAKTVT
jgi:hypothetical protein